MSRVAGSATARTSPPSVAPDVLARSLGLGDVIPGSVRNLKPGDRNPVWALDTAAGRWVVKTNRPTRRWWAEGVRRASRLERVAAKAGISVPRAVAPMDGAKTVGLWTKFDTRFYLRAMERVEGANPPPEPISVPLAQWVGATLAALEAVAPRIAGPWSVTGYGTNSPDAWSDWLDEGREVGLLSDQERDDALSLITVSSSVIENAISTPIEDELRLLHRDVSRSNILLAADGPVLIDFDHAGAQHPWWEAVGQIFQLASPQHGPLAPERDVVAAALDAYRAAGGIGGPAAAEAFAGLLAARLSFAAWLLWNACGHRGGDAAWQSKCGRDFRSALVGLRSIQESAAEWAEWLG